MVNLTQTAYWTRKTLKFGAILIGVIIFLRITFSLVNSVWKKIHPAPPPPPTVAFGKLPKLNFSQSNSGTKLTFKLETIQGGLPKLSTVSKVYFIPKEGPNLLALDRANQMAKKFGFSTQPQQISEKVYRWTTGSTPSTTLDIDINTENFHLAYDYQNDQEILKSKDLPTSQEAAQEAKNFLANNGLLTDDLATGSAEIVYLKFTPPNLTPAVSLSEADFVRINLFRSDLDGLKVLPPNPKNSMISFLFSGLRTLGKRIIEINYTYYPIETETFATYPLKITQTAWQELQGGSGYIANLGENQDGQITVRNVYLAYFDSDQPQNFLQPIFVFEGDRNFVGYVSAIDSKWTD